MAAHIYDADVVVSIREPMWHQLGSVLDEHMSLAEMQELVTPWEAVVKACYTEDGILIPNRAIVRDDTGDLLGVVGPDYEVFTNAETWGFFEEFMTSADLRIETAGTLFGGKRVWVMARMEDFVIASDQDVIRPYIYLANSHDGSLKVSGGLIEHRIVCANTLKTAIEEAFFQIKHTKGVRGYVIDAAEQMGLVRRQLESDIDVYQQMANQHPNEEEVEEVLETLFPANNEAKRDTWTKPRTEVANLFRNSETCNLPGMEETSWGLYNAITEYSDYYKHRNWSAERSWLSATEGQGADFKEQALALCYNIG